MKTLTMYLRASKTEAEAAGLETDGMASSVAKLRQELLALTGQKLDIQIDENNFKSSFQILKELSAIWDEIGEKSGDVTQANILNLLGGKRNANVLSSIITNFNDAIDASETAADSMGSAWKENEKYLDSIEGKTKQMQAAFETFANEVLNSSLVKGFVDLQKNILNVATALSKVGALIPTLVLVGSTIKTIRDSLLADKAVASLTSLASTEGGLSKAVSAFNSLTPAVQKLAMARGGEALAEIGTQAGFAQTATTGLGAAFSGLKTKVSGIGAAIKTMLSSWVTWVAVIAMVISAIRSLIQKAEEARQKVIQEAKDQKQAYEEANDTYKKNIDSLEKLRGEYEKLSRGVDEHGNNISLTEAEYEKYLSIVEQIVGISPSVADSFNKEGAQLKTYTGLIDEAIAAQKELLDLQKDAMLSKGEALFTGWHESMEDVNTEYESLLDTFLEITAEFRGKDIEGNFDLDKMQKRFEAFKKVMQDYEIDFNPENAGDLWAGSFIENLYKNYDFAIDVYDAWRNNHLIDALRATGAYTENEISAMEDAIRAFSQVIPEYKAVREDVADYLIAGVDQWDTTRDLYAQIEEAEYASGQAAEIFKNGIAQISDPNATMEENKRALLEYAETFVDAMRDFKAVEEEYLWREDDEPFNEGAFQNLLDRYAEFPSIVKYLAAARSELVITDDEINTMTTDTEKLYELLGKMSSLETFVSGTNAGKSFEEMASSAKEFIDLYNSITGNAIDASDLFVNDEWMTGNISNYITEMVQAVTANNTFVDSNPKLLASLLSLASTLGVVAEATVSFSDAMDAVNDVSSITKSIDDFVKAGDDATDADYAGIVSSLNDVLEKWNEIRKTQAESRGEEYQALTLEDFLGADMNDWDLAKSKLNEYKASLITLFSLGEGAGQNALINLLFGWDTAAEKATKSTYDLSTALNSLEKAAGHLEDGFDFSDNQLDVINDAQKMADEWNAALKQLGKTSEANKTFKDFLEFDADGNLIANAEKTTSALKKMYEDVAYAIIDMNASLTEEEKQKQKSLVPVWIKNLLDNKELKTKTEELKNSFKQIGEAYTFMQEHLAGERVGNMSQVFDDFEKLKELTGNDKLKLTDFIEWDDDLQDFVYKTDLLSSKIDELATKIATEMVDAEIAAGTAMDDALRSDEIEKRANAIKSSLGGVVDVWNQLSSAAGNVKSLQGLKSDYNSYLAGDMSFLDMLSNTISLAETLGITMEDAFDIDSDGKLIVNIENMENGLIGVIDKLEASGTITARLAEQLRLAARAASEVETNAQRIQSAYERAKDAVSAGSGRSRGQQLTYDDYKAMIERDARYADAVQYVNGVMSVNVDLYNQTTEAIAKETAEMALLEAAQRKLKIDEYQKELKTNTKLTNEQRASMQKEIDKLKLEAKGYAVLANEIANATNQFERFRNAAGNSEADTYMDAKSALKMINDVLFNVESELFGELGNEQFHEAIKLLIDPEVDFSDPNWINKVKEKLGASKQTLEDWFGEGTEKNPQTTRSNMNSFWDYLVGGDFATEEIDEAGQHWGKFKENVDVESMAQHFGVTKDAMRAALQQLEKFSALSFDWKVIDPEYYAEVMAKAEELKKASEEAQQKAEEAQKEAEQAKKDADEATAAYESAKESGDEAAEAKAKDAADEAAKKAEEAQRAAEEAKAAAEEAAKNATEQEVSSTDELKKSLEEIIADIEKMTSEPIELDMTSAIESSQTVIDNFTAMLELIGELNAINETLMGVNENVGVVQESVNLLGESEVDIDTTAAVDSIFDIVDAASDAQQAVYNVDGLPIDINESPAISSIQSVINALSALSSAIDAVNRKSISPKSSSPSGGGTGGTGGASSAGGTVSAKGGRTLVGELGREVVVDVDSGRWYTVGNKGPEFVDLPKRAIVFNNSKTEELLGKTTLKLNGYSMASGTKANSGVGGGMINIDALRTPTEKETQKTVQHISDEVEEAVDVLEQLAEAYKLANETLEHLIEHEEFSYFQAERASNYDRMHTVLANEIEIYKAIMKNSQEGIEKLKAEGADDGNEYLQELEESYWDAYRSMYEALDNIRSLYSDALNDEVDNIQSAFKNLTNAVKEYNTSGLISIDTFQAILDNGIEYLGLLKDENGSFDVNANAAQALLQYRKDQLAIETAIAYVNRLQEALTNGEVQKVNELVAAKGQIGRSTWDIVYANLALLKSQGLNNEQYQLALDNINKLRDLANVTMDDFGADDKIAEVKSKFEELNKEIEHYIAHQEFAFQVGERGMNFTAMNTALENEVGYYKRIMEEAQKTISELAALGAKDTDEALQSVEESYWSAYNKMYSTLDQLRKLRMDALSDRLDGLKNSFSSLKKAAEEYSLAGGISLDTLENLLSNGFQYMSLLDEQNGQLVISKDRVNQYINARKNQLAIESALSYVAQVREAVENKEDDRLKNLIDTMDAVSNSTWGYVYAQAALLKTSMRDAQYKAFVANIDKMKTLADTVVYDYAESQGDITDEYEKQKDALDSILKYTEDLIRAENKHQIDALNDQIDAYKKIVDLKKEALDTTKEENDYQDNVAEKVKEIAELQAKADLLALDTSRTASVERQKLLQDIADKQKDLAKYQQDYSLDAQKEALDKDYEAYEENKNLEIEKLEEIVSSEEKVYQLAIARIRDQWDTLFQDLIEWNTEEGSVINQEIVDAWDEATKAVGRYGSAIKALEAFKNASDNVVVADIPMYHSGGIVGDKGSLNEDEVLAVLEKGELVVTKPMKQALYTAVDFVHELGTKLGVKLESIKNFAFGDMRGAFAPAFATPENIPVTQNNNITFSPSFNVEFNGVDMKERDAKSLGRDIATIAADNLFDAFSKRGIDSLRTLRQ